MPTSAKPSMFDGGDTATRRPHYSLCGVAGLLDVLEASGACQHRQKPSMFEGRHGEAATRRPHYGLGGVAAGLAAAGGGVAGLLDVLAEGAFLSYSAMMSCVMSMLLAA